MKKADIDRTVEEMTTNRLREQTRQLAEQAGFILWYGAERRYRKKQIAVDWACNYDDELEKFAELVRADEREACAKLVEADGLARGSYGYMLIKATTRIRARGEK